MINELGINQKVVVIHRDNQSALHLMKNHVYHERTIHIDVRSNALYSGHTCSRICCNEEDLY